MYLMWSLLFYSSNTIPTIDHLYLSVQKWSNIEAMSPSFYNSCLVPLAVILSINSKS